MPKQNKSSFLIKPFLKRNNFRAFFQIISTIFPIISIWLIVKQIINQPFSFLIKGSLLIPIIFLLTLFSSRTFSLMHDCGHNSLFTKRKLNRFFGFLLGLVNCIPQNSWSIDHAFHHFSERIPNYNLSACHKANIHLLQKSKFLKLSDFSNCFKYIIWDNKNEKLIPIS